jgi:hypothetical protein
MGAHGIASQLAGKFGHKQLEKNQSGTDVHRDALVGRLHPMELHAPGPL